MAEKDIAEACFQPSIFNFPPSGPSSFVNTMLKLIGTTHLHCGFTHDENQTNLTVDEFCNDLKRLHKTITFREIEIAFKNGWQKQYGDFFGLSNATYFGWVKGYLASESALKVKKAIQDAKNKPALKPIPSEHEINEQVLGGVLRMFDEFKRGANILDPGNYCYNYLEKVGLLKLTTERKKQIYNEIYAKIRLNTLENKNRTKTIEAALTEALDEGILKAECKRFALKEYFQSLVDLETELSDELNEL